METRKDLGPSYAPAFLIDTIWGESPCDAPELYTESNPHSRSNADMQLDVGKLANDELRKPRTASLGSFRTS